MAYGGGLKISPCREAQIWTRGQGIGNKDRQRIRCQCSLRHLSRWSLHFPLHRSGGGASPEKNVYRDGPSGLPHPCLNGLLLASGAILAHDLAWSSRTLKSIVRAFARILALEMKSNGPLNPWDRLRDIQS